MYRTRSRVNGVGCAAPYAGVSGTVSGPSGRGSRGGARPHLVCPAWAGARRCKSSGELVVATRVNGKVLSREDSAERSR